MSRKPTTAELEQRLRLEADGWPSLSPLFRRRLHERLSSLAPARQEAPARHWIMWYSGAMAVAATVAIATVVAVLATRPAQRGDQAEIAAALGAVVHSSLARRPEAIASAGEQRLAEEARRLLADARQAASPLVAPWRSGG